MEISDAASAIEGVLSERYTGEIACLHCADAPFMIEDAKVSVTRKGSSVFLVSVRCPLCGGLLSREPMDLSHKKSRRRSGKPSQSSKEKAKLIEILQGLREEGVIPRPLEREIAFHPVRRWRLDWGDRELKISVEYEGGAFIGGKCPRCHQFPVGRHLQGAGYTEDCEKYTRGNIAGWIHVRITSKMISDGRARDLIRDAFDSRTGALDD